MTDRLTEIREREAKAIGGEWVWDDRLTITSELRSKRDDIYIASCDEETTAIFVCNAKSDIPYLLERIREAEYTMQSPDPMAIGNYFDKWGKQ